MATLPVWFDLQVSVGASYSAVLTVSAASGAQLGLLGATAELKVSVTPSDPAPLIDITTTSGAQGGLVLGVTFPPLAGLAASGGGALEQLGLATATLGLLPPSATVANLTALALLTTGTFSLGTVVFVTAGAGSYYSWSPSDPSTPTAVTVIAGIGGNWLLAGSVAITFTPVATAALAGYDLVRWALLVTFTDGEVVELVAGRVAVLPPAPPPA